MIRLRFPKSAIQLAKRVSIALGFSCFMFSSSAYAAPFMPDIATMLVNFSQVLPNLMRLVTALAYVLGFYLMVKGVMDLKQFGEARSMMSQEHSIMKPLVTLGVGTMLVYLPSSVEMGLSTFWMDVNPYGYLPDTEDSNWADLTDAAFMVVQLVGVVAFIRGLLMLTRVVGQGQDTFGKAMAYVVSGILCINMYQFLQAVFETLGITGFTG